MRPLTLRKSCISLALFVLSFSFSAFAQDKDWRPVSPEELSAKAPVVESDADAEAIFWEIRIDDSSSDELSMRHYVRVKVFTERGREKYSKFDIPFVKGLRIKDLSARVIKTDGTITEITKEDIFEREIVKAGGVKVKAKSFAVPNIEPGVIVEYKYKETIADGGAKGMRLAFQRDIPVRSLAYYYKPFSSREPSYQNYNVRDVKFVKDQKGYYLAERRNVPSFREEPRMPPEDMVRPWMLLTGTGINITSASPFGIVYTIKNPGNMMGYWGAVSAENTPLVKFMTKSNSDIKKAAAEITAGAATPEEKLKKIYEFCQSQINNTSFDTTLTDEDRKKLPSTKSIADILKRKSGSAQFIDLLFGALATAAGFEARVAFSGNRSEMFFKPEMTNESLIHPAAIAIKVGSKFQYFNPGMKFLPYGMLVWYEEDTWALLIGEDNFMWERTPITDHENSVANRSGRFELKEDGSLEGNVRIEYSGHPALTYRMDNYDESLSKAEDNLKEEIKSRVSTAEVIDLKIENLTDATKPLVHSYKLKVPNYAQKTGKRLFIQPGFFESGRNPLFSSGERKYDIFFRHPWAEKDNIEIKMPAGFELDNAETPPPVMDPQRIGSLDISIGVNRATNTLVYNRAFYFGGQGNVLFPASAYPALKAMFDTFQKTDTHTITLRQK